MLIGYMRLSKADGSQTLYLQCDALLVADVEPGHLYEDQASGKDLRFVERQSFFAHSSRYAAIVDLGGARLSYRRGTLACCGAAGMRVVIV